MSKQLVLNPWILFVLMATFCVKGADVQSVTNAQTSESLFANGSWEAAFGSGALFSPFVATGGRPTINYTLTGLQFGYMLSEPKEPSWWRGNFEIAGEAFGSAIFQGPGSYIAGFTLWGRYNFLQPEWRFVPFVQAGMGLTATDISREIVGQPFNFNLNIGAGVRYFLAEHWSINLEGRYQHISNANTGPHNLGINSFGPLLGVSYFF